jgi:hypothetical protein
VDEQQRRHHGERSADEDGAGVSPAPAAVGEGDAGHSRQQRREHNRPEVRPTREHHLLAADEVNQRGRNDRHGTAGEEEGHESVTPHEAVIGTGWGVR